MVNNVKTIEQIREIFKADRFATVNGAFIEKVGDGYSVCSLTINENHKNAVGAVMGGVPFMLADFAFAVAANHEEMQTVSLSSNIAFLGVARGEKLIATATCVKNGRSTCYYNIKVCDDLQNLVAEVNVTGFHKQ